MKYQVEILHDGNWLDMCSFKTRAEAENMVSILEEEDKHYTGVFNWDFTSEYRIVEVTK